MTPDTSIQTAYIPNDYNQPHSLWFNEVTPAMLRTEYSSPYPAPLSEVPVRSA